MDSKAKNSLTRKNRRRSARTATINGENDEVKERNNKRTRDNKDGEDILQQDIDLYRDLLDLVPAEHLNCSPTEHPAPPGTRVNLHGVILHETATGLIVLNVRWRNKVYSGALLDVEKNKWACDRVKDQNSECPFQVPPPIKKLKIPTSSVPTAEENNETKKKSVTSPTTPTKNTKASRNNNKKRVTPEAPSQIAREESSPTKKTKKLIQNTDLECPEPDCDKKYKNKSSLANHMKNVHEKNFKADNDDDQICKDKSDDSDSGEDQFVIDEKEDTTDENKEEAQENLTENEKQIERIKLKLEQSEKYIQFIKQESPNDDEIPTTGHGAFSGENKPDTKPVLLTDIVVKNETNTEEIRNEVETTSSENKLVNVPSIHVEHVFSTEEEKVQVTTEVKLEDSYPRGSSHTIIHEDNLASLNELFAPAQTCQQYSPTLSQLNPQTINESLTDALAKPPNEAEIFSKDAAAVEVDKDLVVKNVLMAKPSLEVSKPLDIERINFEKLKLVKTFEMLGCAETGEKIECSDDERSISPDNLLKDCHKTYPQDEQQVENVKPNLMNMTVASGNLFVNPIIHGVLSQPQKTFENTLLAKELSGKLSSTAVTINSLQTKLPPRPLQEYPQHSVNIDPKKVSPQLLNFIKSGTNYMQTTDTKPILMPSSIDNNSSIDSSSAKQSLLQQRLLGNIVKPDTVLSSSVNSTYLQSNTISSLKVPTGSNDAGNDSNKLQMSLFNIRNERIGDMKLQGNGSEERVGGTRTWFPENIQENPHQTLQQHANLPKDFFCKQPVQASFRLPATTSQSANNIHVYNPIGNDKGSKFVLKRSPHPIPIAPAPSTVLSNIPTSMVMMSRPDLASTEYSMADTDMEQPQMNRYTLTSDNRLIPSPAENRGRPRKIRVEKTQRVPIGTAEEIARSRGPTESPVMRKHPHSPVARASVIQGALQGPSTSDEVTNHGKLIDRTGIDEHPLYQQARNFETEAPDERERFALLGKMQADLRKNPDKYKEYANMSSTSMFRPTRQNRPTAAVLSPPNAPSSSALESLPSSISPEVMPYKAHYQLAVERMKSGHRTFLEMHSKPELTPRVPDTLRPGDLNQKPPTFSSRDNMIPNPMLSRMNELSKDHRIPDFQNALNRFPGPGLRPDYLTARSDTQRISYDPSRPTLEEKDSTRLRGERFQSQTPPASHPNSSPSTPHSTQQPTHLSNNLVLGRADGAILGPLSYDYHNNERKR